MTAVNRDRTPGDGQPQADPAALPASVPLDPEERLEEGGQRILRDTRAEVPHRDPSPLVARREGHHNRRPRRGVANGVTDDVLEGPPQQLRVSLERSRPRRNEL